MATQPRRGTNEETAKLQQLSKQASRQSLKQSRLQRFVRSWVRFGARSVSVMCREGARTRLASGTFTEKVGCRNHGLQNRTQMDVEVNGQMKLQRSVVQNLNDQELPKVTRSVVLEEVFVVLSTVFNSMRLTTMESLW